MNKDKIVIDKNSIKGYLVERQILQAEECEILLAEWGGVA